MNLNQPFRYQQNPQSNLYQANQFNPIQQQQPTFLNQPSSINANPSFQQPQMFGNQMTANYPPNVNQSFSFSPNASYNVNSPEYKIQALVSSLDPNSPTCRFQTFLYNMISPDQIDKFPKPKTVSQVLWDQAIRENPDPKGLVPVLCTSFQQLKERKKQQDECQKAHLEHLINFSRDIQETELKVQIKKLRKVQFDLSHRLIQVMKHIDLLQSRGYPLLKEEITFANHVSHLHSEIHRDDHCWNVVHDLSNQVRLQPSLPKHQVGPIIEKTNIDKLHTFLLNQNQALSHMTRQLQKDSIDLNIMTKGLSQSLKNKQTNSSNNHLS